MRGSANPKWGDFQECKWEGIVSCSKVDKGSTRKVAQWSYRGDLNPNTTKGLHPQRLAHGNACTQRLAGGSARGQVGAAK